MQNLIFIAQESSQYMDFFKIMYVNRIVSFDFCVYKNVSQKKKDFCI